MIDESAKVDAYIAAQADFARPILNHFRALVHAAQPDATEAMKWSFPHFVYKDKNLASMAAFKGHAAIGFWYSEDETPARAQQGGMGHLGKISSIADLPSDDELRAMLARAAAMIDAGAKPQWMDRRQPRAALPIHPALTTAIQANPDAAAFWSAFPPGKIRDYAEWIGEAKTDITRDRRIAQAVEWIAEGKGRNWKYEKR
ncbi:YdeI/OmpD-associated family protein [Sphingobium sp.]|uniref:YdeI/OmpD-associated family protein n=1 Tax=Sphingobium sp. TaxID=1912891 RepID=UPI002CBF916A|nr:YdeI/OmpD-associated family protein [Sphingobium sp.]HUD93154.1 YdeI/OmpD-associated family protein [Sphingobium sp.]